MSEAVGVTRWIGDLLLHMPAADDRLPGRHVDSGWDRCWQGNGWRLWAQDAGSRWRGYPLSAVEAPEGRLWLVGELYGEDGRPPGDVLAEIAASGRDPGSLNGHFLLLAWLPDRHQWHAWTDRFGTLHAYHAWDGERAALGTFFPAVAAAASRRQLDWPALAGFFSLGFFPQDRTFFDDVRVLRPASHYVFDETGRLLSQERYWQWWHEPNRKRSYDETVGEFASRFGEVMTDLLAEGRIALPISGGLDSRCTVSSLNLPPATCHPQCWAYSYGYTPNSVETRIAARVAAARDLPFQAFTIRPYLFDRLDQVLASVEGFQDVTQCRQASVVDEITAHADYLIAAHWGDVWLDDMGLVHAGEGRVDDGAILSHALHKMLKGGRRWLVDHLCRPHLDGEDPEELVRQAVREELDRIPPIDDPDFRVKALKTDQWSFRWTLASVRMFQPAAFPRLPFYDTRLADFFCTVPSAWVAGRRLQIDYLKRFAPDLARITWQVYDANLYQYRYFNSWLLPKRAVKKAWRLLTRARVVERNWEVQLLGPAGRRGLEEWLLQAGRKLHDLVPVQEVRALLDEFYTDPRRQGGYGVSMLLTFSAWLERYG